MLAITIQEMGFINPIIRSGSREYNFIKDQLHKTRTANRNKWVHTPHPEHGSKVLIDYRSIPPADKIKLNMPLDYKEAQKLIKEHLNELEASQNNTGGADSSFYLVASLKKCIEQNYLKYISMYAASYNNDVKLAEKYSREHALRIACTELVKGEGLTLKELHAAYLQLSQAGTQNAYTKFTNLLKHQWSTTDGACLIHGHKGKERPDLKKLTEKHKGIIEELYKHPNQYSHAIITELLNRQCAKEGLPEVVRRTVSGYLEQPDVYNRLLIFRNKEAYGKKVKPINRRTGALNAGDLYYMDGSPSQIPCMNREGSKEIRPTIFIVLDSNTRKVTGWCIAETEDRYTWFGAMKMAFSMESALPYEIVYDNASATGTAEFTALNSKLLLSGCRLRPAKPGEPTAKAQVERWFGSFQSGYQRMIDGFTGEGIRSKRETGRIDAEYLKKVRKQNGVFTFDELVELISFLIAAYNQKGTPKHPNPAKKFAECSKPNMTALQPEKLALLFWNSRPITVRNSEVKMTIRHNEYFYSVNDYTLNGQTVKVYYDETDLSNVHLFNSNDEYICEVTQKVLFHEAQANQTNKDRLQIMGQASHNMAFERKLKQDGKNRTEKVRAEFGDDFLKMVNPLEMLKDDYNNAETEQALEYVREQTNLNPLNMKIYSPVTDEPIIEKKFKNKHTKTATLEVHE